MLPDDFDFLLPLASQLFALQEAELPEAFDRAQPQEPKKQRRAKRKKRRVAPKDASWDVSGLLVEFLDELIKERRLSPGAFSSYKKDLQVYLAWLQVQGVPLRQVTAEQVDNYKRALQSGQIHKTLMAKGRPALHAKFYAAPTLARKLAAVREWHRFLAREYGWPDPRPFLDETALPLSQGAPKRLVLSSEQMQALLGAPNRLRATGKRDRAILYLLCEGVSAPEIIALRYDTDWDSQPNVGEGARAALCEYSERARPLLERRLMKKKRNSSRLFFSNRGTPLSSATIHQIVRRHAKTADLPYWLSSSTLTRSGALRRAGGDALAALPRSTHLRHAYEKAHPRS